MHAPSARRLLLTLLLAASLTGCGKSLPAAGSGEAGAEADAPVSAQGANGLVTKNTTRLGGADAVSDAAAVARAVYPGLTAATRAGAVVLVDEHDWTTALAASALASAPLHAALLYSDGAALPELSSQALQAMRPTGSARLGGAQVVQLGGAAAPVGYRTISRSAPDPFTRAAEIARLLGAVHGRAPRQVIVVGADGPPAFAMPAAGLAAQTGAPILLVSAAGVPVASADVLRRLHKPSIYVVGPTAAVGESVARSLARFGPVKRIAGADPVANAIAVAQFSDGSFGWGVQDPGHGLVFANASRALDAPAAALLSASGDYSPLLLLARAVGIPPQLARYLQNIQPGYSDAPAYRPVRGVYNHGWLIGDEQAIAASTQAELDALLEISAREPTTTTTQGELSTSTSTSPQAAAPGTTTPETSTAAQEPASSAPSASTPATTTTTTPARKP